MAINFPHNPNINDVHTESSLGKSWKWDGTSWLIYSSATTGIGYSDLSVQQQAASGTGSLSYNNANGVFTYIPPVVGGGGGGGSSTFVGLTDTPTGFTAGKWLKVNTGGTGLEWTDAPSGSNTTYDLTASNGSIATEEKILLTGSDSSEDAVTLAVSGSLTIARVDNKITFGDSVPTTITVANESTDIECYPLFTTEATGNLAPKTVTSFKLNSSSGQLEAGSFKKTGGSSSEFLKADGSVDSTTYLSSAPSYALNDLSDVTTGTISDGDVLKYSGTNSRWEAQTDASGATTLGALTDVDTTGAANGKIIKHNGTSWVIADDASSGGGGSANFTGLSDTPGSLQADKWVRVNSVATELEFTNAPALSSLTDVTISGSPGDDSILQFDSTDSKWKPASLGNSGNTTYTLSAVQGGTSVNIRLTGSDSTEDNVLLTPGSGLSLASITVDGFTINSTDTLDTITGRGATTNNDVTVGSITCDNLTVNGTTTTVNSNTVEIGDSNLTLNSDETGAPSQNGGLTIERGTSTNVQLRWNETTDKWQYTNDGTNYNNIGSSSTDNDTTYSISCVDGANSDEERIRLTASGSGSGTDDVVLEAGTGLSVARDGDKITFTNTVSAGSDTTYDMRTAAVTGGGIIRLENELDNTTDDIQILGGTSITVDRSADHKLTINSDITNLNSLSDVTISGSVGDDSILQYDTGDQKWKPVDGDSVGTTIPAGTIVMYNGDTAPSGWALCDGGGSRPDLRDKFVIGSGNSYNRGSTGGYNDAVVVSHNHGSGNTGNQSANHTHGSGNYSGNTSQHNGHTHDDGNYDAALNGSHTHQANVTNNTGSQSHNHYHTIGSNKPDGSPGTWNATVTGGTHGHGFQTTNSHPQSNMSGIKTEGGDGGNINNTYILSNGGAHNHTVNLTGVTTGGVDQNHTHALNFNINTSPPLTQSEHSHNITGNSGSGGNHSHNVNFSGSSGNQSANHTHSIDSEGVSGSGKNLPPYYAITFIIKL